MRTKYILISILLFIVSFQASSQDNKMILTLNDVIRIASDQSFDALIAKHTFRGNYWRYRSFKASYLPLLSLKGSAIGFDNSISQEWQDGEQVLVEHNNNLSNINLSVNQNIGLTGGRIFAQSQLAQIDNFESSSRYFTSSPVIVGFSQPIFGFNQLKWDRKIEPLKYEESRKAYIESMEQVSLTAINNFFNLILAQINLNIAEYNYNNSDTLFKISEGRFNIGTIAKNELLQMELSFLGAKSALQQAQLNLEISEFRLRSFLGYNEAIRIELIVPTEIPDLEIDYTTALNEALKNNAEILSYNRQLIQAKRDVSRAKAERGFKLDLFAQYGLNTSSTEANRIYSNPDNNLNSTQLNIGFAIPILDWGQGQGRVKMARSQQEVINTSVRQKRVDFEQNIYLKVKQFNIQGDQLFNAQKADTIAQFRYEVSKQRFLIGKIDALELNVAFTEKDQKRRAFVSALRNYYVYYYNIRKVSLYDFINGNSLLFDEGLITN